MADPTQPQPELHTATKEYAQLLYKLGARFVELDPDKDDGKAPVEDKSWKTCPRPKAAEVHRWLKAGNKVGIVPGSFGAVGLDLDYGDDHGVPRVVNIAGTPDYLALPSMKAGRHHIYLYPKADWPEKWPGAASRWQLKDGSAGGEVRYKDGYLVVHGGSHDLVALADWAQACKEKGDDLVRVAHPPFVPPTTPAAKAPTGWQPGNRHTKLFRDACRYTREKRDIKPLAARALKAGLPQGEIDRTINDAQKAVAKERAVGAKNAEGLAEAFDSEGWAIRFNTLARRKEIHLNNSDGWQALSEMLTDDLREQLAIRYCYLSAGRTVPLRFSVDGWKTATANLARQSPVNPVQEWLLSLPARTPGNHILNAFSQCFRHSNSEYSHWIIRAMWLGTVERIMEPGCPQRVMPVIVGDQDCGKTSWVRHMLPDELMRYFQGRLTLGGDPKERVHNTMGVVLAECAELSGSRKVGVEEIKALLDLPFDKERLKYAADSDTIDRTYYTIGTANRNSLPADDANSRYTVLEVEEGEHKPHELLPQVRDACWRQALDAYRQGERVGFLPDHLKPIQREGNRGHSQIDEVLTNKIEALPCYEGWATMEAIQTAIDASDKQPRAMGIALRAAGFVYQHRRFPMAGRRRAWLHPEGDAKSDRLRTKINWLDTSA